MRRNLIVILLALSPLVLFGQEGILLDRAYPELPFAQFAQELERDQGVRVYYQQSMVDTLRTPAISQGTGLEEAITSALQGSKLAFYLVSRQVFVFEGESLITEFLQFDPQAEVEKSQVEMQDKKEQGDELYLLTKTISEKRNLLIGSREQAVRGRKSVLSGHISSVKTGEALIGATIYVRQTGVGTISDVDGNFQLNLNPGNYIIMVQHMAMKETEYGLTVLSDGSLTIELDENLIELEEITVTDKRHSNVKGMFMGYERISVKSMKEVPVVLGEKDVLKIVQLLPGVQNAGEGSAGFNVRGGSADQNMFYINNISIYNTSHLFGFFTSFSPDIVSDFALYKNNVPAKYGGRIASIFNITTWLGNKNHFFAQGGISPITAHLAVEGPIVKEKVSYVVSGRSTYSDWILSRLNDYDLQNSNASFNDFTIGIDAKINPDNNLNLFLLCVE